MPVEQFANIAQTTLSLGANNSVTSISITSATGFSSTGNFRIIVDQEIMLVTTVVGTLFGVVRGVEGTTAVAHSTGAQVTQILTGGGVAQALARNVVTTAGTSTAYTVSLTPTAIAYDTGPFFIKFNSTCGASPTLNPDGLGAKNLQYCGQAVVAGQLISGTTYCLFYDGTQYQIIGAGYRPPVRTVLTSGTGTYTVPAACKYLDVIIIGGGGGGAGGGSAAGAGVSGGGSTFGTSLMSASGGTAGSTTTGGTGGGASGGDVNIPGGNGQFTLSGLAGLGGIGAPSVYGGTGLAGGTTPTNSGGGGGGGAGTTPPPGAGGSAGGYCQLLITSPATSYSYAVGAGGGGGTAGTGGFVGVAGAAGIVIVTAYF